MVACTVRSPAEDRKSVLHAKCGKIPVIEFRDICMVSDGFSEFFGMFSLATPEAFMELAATQSGEALFQQLLSAQKADSAYTKHPRFKLSDDATVLYALTGETEK